MLRRANIKFRTQSCLGLPTVRIASVPLLQSTLTGCSNDEQPFLLSDRQICCVLKYFCGSGSSVSIVTELQVGWSGDRIPVGRDFPPVHTCPGAHPASCTMGTGSFSGVKYGRGVLLTTHPILVPWSWKSRVIPLPNLWAATGPVTGSLYIFFTEAFLDI